MDPHPLSNIFKTPNYDEPIASELSALDYLYEVLHKIRGSENCDEEIYEVIHDDCTDYTINSINVNCANNMQNPKLGDACFVMSAIIAMIMIGVIMFLMILKIYLSLMMNMFAIKSKVGLEECQL